MSQFNIAVIPGDGIGTEVIPEGLKVLEAAANKHGIKLQFTHFDWSCETYHRTGRMMPEDGLEQLKKFDAIFLGAVGFPGVPDHISLWGLLLPIRRAFNQYVNLRPVRLFDGIKCPLADKKPGDIDFYVVRENVEGEYSAIGGIQYEGTDEEMVLQQSIFTRKGTERILKYAFDLAQSREKKHLSSATKSNGLFHSMPYWDSRVAEMAKQYPDIKVDQFHIDIFAANLVRMPEFYDVIVGSNLFGDILSDEASMLTGSIGMLPSASLDENNKGMYEPIHGSAPDIAGKGIANPIATILSCAMMLRYSFGLMAEADAVENAVEAVLDAGHRTADIAAPGEKALSTSEMGALIRAQL